MPGEAPIEGVRREIEEETSVQVNDIKLFDVDCDIRRYKGREAHLIFIRYVCNYLEGEALPGDDAKELLWIHRKDLAKYTHNAPSLRFLRKLGLI